MCGVTDAPFRRLAESLGAGLVVSEMAACAALARARPDVRLRIEGQGIALERAGLEVLLDIAAPCLSTGCAEPLG